MCIRDRVYAGGGITPDVYVPYDSLLLNGYYQDLSSSITKFSFKYIEENDFNLSEEEFISNFRLDDSVVTSLQSFHATDSNNNSNLTDALNISVKRAILNELKARMGKQLYGDLAFYKILHSYDPIISSALDAQKTYTQLTEKH